MLLKKFSVYVAIAGVLSVIVLVTQLYSKEPPGPAAIGPAINPYTKTVSASGIIEAKNENVIIGVPAPGLVAEVHVKVWDKVKGGDPLFVLDSRELAAQLMVHKASAKVAQANLARLQDQLSRWHAVKDLRAVSRDDLRLRENDVRVSKAQLDLARAQVEQTQTLIDRLTIRAPKDGTILQSNVRPGEFAAVTPMQPAIVLGDLDNLQIRADVDEQNAVRVRVSAPATAFVKGSAHEKLNLSFVRIEPLVVPKKSLTGVSGERVDTRVLQVIYAFEQNPDHPYYVGQQVDVFISDENLPEPVSLNNPVPPQKGSGPNG